MPLTCALALALLLPTPQRTDPDMPARVAALLEDLDDPSLGRLAHIELVALGALSAPTLARRAISDSRDQTKALPRLVADPISARIALLAAIECAQQVPAEVPEDRSTARLRRIVDARLRARRLAEQLAPYVDDAATLCAPLLAETADTERLRVRTRYTRESSLASLDAAMGDGEPLEVEVVLELIAQRGDAAAPLCGRTLQRLWDARAGFHEGIGGREAEGVDAHTLETLAARAVVAVLPDDDRVADACAFLLSTSRDVLELVPLLERVATLGPAAARCLPALRGACLADDDRICRLALDTLAHLGPVAAPLLPDLELRAEHAADPESRRLARLAIRRIAHPDDTAGRISDLLDDLLHPTRCGPARRELSAMGKTAAPVLLATLGDRERAAVWPDAIDLLHALAPSDRDAVAAVFGTAPSDFAHATWRRLRIAVDLIAGTDAEAVARAQLRTWAAADAEQASRCAALLDRLAALAAVGSTATDAELAAALGTGTPATAERAARLLHARAPLTPELLAALTAAVARVDPDFDSNEDALRSDGRSRVVAARTLLAHTQAPPPAAFTVAMAHGSAGQRIELLRAVDTFAWPPEEKVAQVRPFLADAEVDEVRIAALDALAKLGAATQPLAKDLECLAGQRWNRALARAAQRAQRGAGR